jgi:hypothetical protein
MTRRRRVLASVLAALLMSPAAFAKVTLEVGRTAGAPAYPRTNGRQIARSADGTWFVAYDALLGGERGVAIAVARKTDPGLAGDFQPPVAVVGGTQAVLRSSGGDARAATLVIDRSDVLHLLWQTSAPAAVWHAQCRLTGGGEAASRVARAESWTAPERIDAGDGDAQLGDAAAGADGSLWVAYTRAAPAAEGGTYRLRESGAEFTYSIPNAKATEVWLARSSGGSWSRKPLTEVGPFGLPVLDLDRSGTLHVAFKGGWFLLYRQLPDVAARFVATDWAATPAEAAWAGTAYVSYSVIGWGKQALLAFEKVEHAMVYCHFDGSRWTRRPLLPVAREQMHHPLLVRDGHDVGWAFWINGTRNHTFYARWLGGGFSRAYESRTLPSDPSLHDIAPEGPALEAAHTAQKEAPAGSEAIGVAVTSTESSGGVYFDRVRTPGLRAEKGRKVLFLDMLEVAGARDVEPTFHPLVKHPANPVLRPGPAGAFDSLRAHAYGEVLRDGGKFRMWYTAWDAAGALDPQRARHYIGYAESRDGIRWNKQVLDQVEFKGSKANAIVDLDYQGGNAYMPMVIRDEREPSPDRRYKLVVEQARGNTLHYSADGIRWTSAGTVNPRLTAGGERSQQYWGDRRNLFYDTLEKDPERRWKVYSHCMVPDLVRKTCLSTSPDLVTWTPDPRNPIMHPRAGGELEQHLTSVWPHGGVYVGMIDVWDPVQLMDQKLITSRDGTNFVHVFDDRYVLERGKPGAWDAGWVSPANVPVEVGDQEWYYYSGSATTIGPQREWHATPMFTGLATIRRDGFVSLGLRRGAAAGFFETIPFAPSRPLGLEINADGLGAGKGTLTFEVVRGGEVLARSKPLGEGGVHVPVAWEAGAAPAIGGSAPVRLRVRLTGTARLYSFTFR